MLLLLVVMNLNHVCKVECEDSCDQCFQSRCVCVVNINGWCSITCFFPLNILQAFCHISVCKSVCNILFKWLYHVDESELICHPLLMDITSLLIFSCSKLVLFKVLATSHLWQFNLIQIKWCVKTSSSVTLAIFHVLSSSVWVAQVESFPIIM